MFHPQSGARETRSEGLSRVDRRPKLSRESLHSRLRQLEHLVQSLQDGSGDKSQDNASARNVMHRSTDEGFSQDEINKSNNDSHDSTTGKLIPNETSNRYVDAAHWQAILGDVSLALLAFSLKRGEKQR